MAVIVKRHNVPHEGVTIAGIAAEMGDGIHFLLGLAGLVHLHFGLNLDNSLSGTGGSLVPEAILLRRRGLLLQPVLHINDQFTVTERDRTILQYRDEQVRVKQ